MEAEIKILQRVKEEIFIILGVAVAALIIGITLELMGYDALVEGLIISFGFFLIHAHVETLKEIRSGNEKIKEGITSVKESVNEGANKLIEVISIRGNK